MAKPTNAEIEAKRAVIAEAREQALQAKAETIRVKAHNKAENIRRKADAKAKRAIAKGEAHAAKIEGVVPAEIEQSCKQCREYQFFYRYCLHKPFLLIIALSLVSRIVP